MSRSLQAPVAAVIGAITGVVAILLVQSHVAPAAPSPAAAAGPVQAAGPGALPPADLATDRRLSALELQLRTLSHPADPETPPPPASPEDKYAAVEQARQAFAQRLADHEAAGRDPRWAAPTERAITDSLGKLAGDAHPSFSVAGVDCRTTTCVARLDWSDAAAARAEIRTLVQNADVSCARQVTLPDASSAAGSYQVAVLFDCAAPAGGAERVTASTHMR